MPLEVKEAILYHTSFVHYSDNIALRVSFILNGVTALPICIECGTEITPKNNILTAHRYCSLVCSNRNPQTKARKKQTCISRYGVENPFNLQEKIQDAVFRKYGVNNVSKLENVRNKISESNLKNSDIRMERTRETLAKLHNVNHVSQLESVKNKKKETCIEKYGANTYISSSEFKEKEKVRLYEQFGVTNVSQLPETIEKIANTKKTRYGSEKYNNSEKSENTMQVRYGGHYSTSDWDDNTRRILSSRELLEQELATNNVYSLADRLGVATSTLYARIKEFEIIDWWGKTKNYYEEKICEHLSYLNIPYERNVRNILDGKELDIFIPSRNVAIECNGIYWHSELLGKGKMYHLEKTILCEDNSIRLLHFWDYQMDRNFALVLNMISHILGKTMHKVNARNTIINPIAADQYRRFLAENHLQGEVNSSVRYGLFEHDQLIMILGLGKSRFKEKEYEIHRFATKQNFSVRGGASKLFTRFLRDHDAVTEVVSYAERDYSDGEIYKRLGFELVHRTPPSYLYFYNRTVYNRMKFQKHKLKSLLADYDPKISEWENMKRNGYNRFWNTGNLKYVYKRR